MSEEYQCIMLPVEEKILLSETVTFVIEDNQIIGTLHKVPCPGVRANSTILQSPMMYLDDFESGRFRHERWKRMIGKK